MAKKRKSKHEQTVIATEVSQQQLRLKLLRQIALLKRLPKDFRDITLGTDWEAFADITGRREEMDRWYHGPIMCIGKLNQSEEAILGSPNELVGLKMLEKLSPTELEIGNVTELTSENWLKVIQLAEEMGCSWIYLPNEKSTVVDAFNIMFSRFGFNIRAKGQLISEHTGKPVGVVH